MRQTKVTARWNMVLVPIILVELSITGKDVRREKMPEIEERSSPAMQ
jgi:hypothetical protein